jgi:hypothetical protein
MGGREGVRGSASGGNHNSRSSEVFLVIQLRPRGAAYEMKPVSPNGAIHGAYYYGKLVYRFRSE